MLTLIFTSLSANCEAKMDCNLSKILPANPFFIPSSTVQEITTSYDLEVEELLQLLIPIAQSYARPPVSNYRVGVAVLGKSGNIYLGVNLEFLGVPLHETIHAEQFAITNARSHGETELLSIALSAAPCGHCRQFLNEMGGSDDLQILIAGFDSTPLSALLPASFGPQDLGLEGNLLTPLEDHLFCEGLECALNAKAARAALTSYAPYSKCKSGVAIQTKDGKIYAGSYLENAAFNPSISPLLAALISLVADGQEYSEISKVVLVEEQSCKISQEALSRELLKNIAPNAVFRVF